MIHIDASPDERRRGTSSSAHRKHLIAAMQRDGVLVLQQVVDHAPLDALKLRMDRDSLELLAFCDSIGGNPRDRGHLQQGPPPMAPYVFPEYVANLLVCDALRAILGAGAYCEFYNGNTNCPDSTYQQLHLDAMHPPSSDGVASPTAAVVVNVVPQDVDERNGAVELWPGTHLIVSGDKPKGRPITFARDCEMLLANAPLPFNATFTDEPIDYLLGPTKRMLKALQGPRAARVTRH